MASEALLLSPVQTYLEATRVMHAAFLEFKTRVASLPVSSAADRQVLLAQIAEADPTMRATISAFTQAGQALSSEELNEQKNHVQGLLHPLLMGSPFAHRSYTKPLGYAGDYQMVNQILGDPFEGETAYDQAVNCFLLQSAIAQGHRNRVAMLHALISEKATRAHQQGKRLRVLSIGCGPAEETQRFLREHAHPEVADIELLDFSRETLDWTAARLESIMAQTGRRANVTTIERSVYDLAKKTPEHETAEYDLVICAGLFDYLTDRFARRVVNYCVAKTVVGGTTLVTNVAEGTDNFFIETLLDWKLILRSPQEVTALLPTDNPALKCEVVVDDTFTNVIGTVTRLG